MTSSRSSADALACGVRYRDGSKRTQPLNTSKDKTAEQAVASVMVGPIRHKLPDERKAITHKFDIAGHEGYITVGLFEDGQPGEIFIRMAKAGSTIAGLMDSFGIAFSMALQFGVSLKVLCDKFSHTRFEPSGWSSVKEIGYAKSIMDYIARWLALKFLPPPTPSSTGVGAEATAPASAHPSVGGLDQTETDAPSCKSCGAIMTKNGSGYRCENCGSTSGDLQ